MTEPAIFANIFIKKMIVSETIFIEFPRIFTTFHPRKGKNSEDTFAIVQTLSKRMNPRYKGLRKGIKEL